MPQKINGPWALAIAFYGIGDTVTTYVNLFSGFRELNPLINLYTLIPLKILVLIFLVIVSEKIRERTLVPSVLIILGLVGIARNILLLFSTGKLI
ncbi:MAG: hypothetical protein ACOC5L_03985 [Halobacteriota archaeon]